jgi:hypothetical protein
MLKGQSKITVTKEYCEQAFASGKTRRQVSKDLGICTGTLNSYLLKLGIPRLKDSEWTRVYKEFNPAGFETLDNPIYAYWAGFIAADGCINVHKNKVSTTLHIKITDYNHLLKFKTGLNLEQPISFGTTINSYNDKRHPYCEIHVSGKTLGQALGKWGITPRKSLTIQWPENLPEKAIPHFIRGYFDGNGTIYVRHRHKPTGLGWTETVCRFISGSPDFLNSLEVVLNGYGIITNKKYKNGETNAYVLPISGKIDNLLRFSSLLYSPGVVCLERKKVYFDALLEKAA